jgi:virginiamycin B lyase
MRRIAPLIIGITTIVLILAGTALPTAALAAAEIDRAPTDDATPVTVIHPPAGAAGAFGISDGPGGVWFSHGATLDRVTPHGLDEFPMPDPTTNTGTLAWKQGGPLWFADRANSRIGSIDQHGIIETFDIPHPAGGIAVPQGIVIGPGTDIWFTDFTGASIDRLNSVTGTIAVQPVPTPASGPLGLVRGPDGALWFTERTAAKVGRLAPDGTFTEWALAPGAFPNRITVGPDRAIWFTELNAGKLGRFDSTRKLTEYPVSGGPVGITTGPGHALYVTLFTDKALVRVDTTGQVNGRWELPGALGPVQTTTVNGAVWVADPNSDTVYKIRPHCD